MELDEQTAAAANDRSAVVEERDALGQQIEQLQERVARLTNENAELVACKSTLSDEQTRLQNEIERLAKLEREMQVVVASRETASEELHGALLHIAELKEQDDRHRALVDVYETLSGERDQLLQEVNQLRDQLKTQADERGSIEAAWTALSGEAAAASESQTRLTEENSKLLAELDEVKRHLEKVRQDHAAWADSKETWEHELAAKAETEAAALATIADVEKKLDEQGREFAESKDNLEQQLAAARDAQTSVHQARDDWQRQCGEAQRRCAEQSGRIIELERQLADKGMTAQPVEADTVPMGGTWHETSSESGRPAAEDAGNDLRFVEFSGQSNSGRTDNGPAEYEWPYLGTELNSDALAGASTSAVGQNSSTLSTAADELHAESTENHMGSVAADSSERPAAVDNHSIHALQNTTAWDGSPDECDRGIVAISEPSRLGAGECGDEQTPNSRRQGPAAWPTNPELRLPNGRDDEATSLTGSLSLNQTVLSPEPVLSGREAMEPSASSDSEAPDTTKTAKKLERTSFIERYSHLFNDDEPAHGEQAVPIISRGQVAEPDNPRESGPLRSGTSESPVRNDDDESIEQYMAKLLQRVRGDAAKRNATVAQLLESSEPTSKTVSEAAVPESNATKEPASKNSANDGGVVASETHPLQNDEPLQRKVATQMPTSDLGALRALANETARRAIGRHDVRKYRRDAVKKLMIATLTGMASGWLMFTSHDWQSLQFVTGGVFLLVAAFWGWTDLSCLMGIASCGVV